MIALYTPNGNQGVTSFGPGIGHEVLQLSSALHQQRIDSAAHLADFIASIRQTGVAVLSLRPDLDFITKLCRKVREKLHGGRPELGSVVSHLSHPSVLTKKFSLGIAARFSLQLDIVGMQT